MPNLLTRPILALALAALLSPAPVLAEGSDAGAYLAARVAGGEGDFRAAATWYTRALISDPKNPALLEGAIIANMGVGNFSAAATVGKQMQALKIPNESATLAIMSEQAKAGDFAAILADDGSEKAIGALLHGLVSAWAELGNGRMSDAQAAFDKIGKTKGLEVFGLYHKALALAAVGDFEGADGILSGKTYGSIQLLPRGIIAHAQILSQLERNADAIALLDSSFGPNNAPATQTLRAQLEAGETVPYDIAANATDGIAEVFFTMASALSVEAENGYTLLYARVASYLRPSHVEAQLLTAGLLDQQRQYDLAAETYALVPASDPSFYAAEIGRADALYAAGKVEASIEALQGLTRSTPDNVTVHVALGDALRREERFEDATHAYDRAIVLIGEKPAPAYWRVFYSRAVCHERQKRWELAEKDFRQALALSPDEPQVLNYLGYSYLEMNQNLDEALSMIERAAKAQPDSGYIIDSLAWALYRLGRYEDALAPMEKASLLEPVDPVVTDHLGDVYWAVGRRLEAQFQWRRALSFDPEEKDAARIRKKLEIGLDGVLADEGQPPLKPVDAAQNNN